MDRPGHAGGREEEGSVKKRSCCVKAERRMLQHIHPAYLSLQVVSESFPDKDEENM